MQKIKLFSLICTIVLLAGCKPTEKNYREAYDRAYDKVQQRKEAENTGALGERIESIDGPRTETIEGETVKVARGRVRQIEDGLAPLAPPPGQYGVAVARFSMKTNAVHHANNLKEKYPETRVLANGDDAYYVVIEYASSIAETIAPTRHFQIENPKYTYPGLGGAPQTVSIYIK